MNAEHAYELFVAADDEFKLANGRKLSPFEAYRLAADQHKPTLTPGEQGVCDAAFEKFYEGWQRMLKHNPDAGNPLHVETWSAAWKAAKTHLKAEGRT